MVVRGHRQTVELKHPRLAQSAIKRTVHSDAANPFCRLPALQSQNTGVNRPQPLPTRLRNPMAGPKVTEDNVQGDSAYVQVDSA
jgi:hypothetical protein